jgi:hypothetical protein
LLQVAGLVDFAVGACSTPSLVFSSGRQAFVFAENPRLPFSDDVLMMMYDGTMVDARSS